MRSLKLNRKLKEQRIAKKITQLELARKVGYQSPQFVSNWERGLCGPPWELLPRLCGILGIPKELVMQILVDDLKRELKFHFRGQR